MASAIEMGIRAVAVLAFVASASAFPKQVRLSVNQRSDEMVVTWVTEYWAGTSYVQYGEQMTALNSSRWTQENTNYDFNGGYGKDTYSHSIRLKDLKPDTKYYYRCGNDNQGWSKIFWFRTVSNNPDANITFAAVSDQDITPNSMKVLNQMILDGSRFPYDFAMIAGDLAFAKGNQVKWNQYGDWMQAFSAYYPTMQAVGDNDVETGDTAAYKARYRWGVTSDSHQWGWAPNWFTFVRGPVRIIVLSSEHSAMAADQKSFLEKTLILADAPEARMLTPWIVVVIHRGAYNNPPGTPDSQKGLDQRLKDAFFPLYQKYKVNVVVCGHCRNYERTFPMQGNKVVDPKRGWEDSPYNAPVYLYKQGQEYPQGTVHVTVGTGGRPVELVGNRISDLYGGGGDIPCIVKDTWGNVLLGAKSNVFREEDCQNMCWSKENSAYMNYDRGYGVFTANRDRLHFKFISAEFPGQLVDEMIMCSMPGCGKAPALATPPPPPPLAVPAEATQDKSDGKQQPAPADAAKPGESTINVFVPAIQQYAPMPVGMNIKDFLNQHSSSNIAQSTVPDLKGSDAVAVVPATVLSAAQPGSADHGQTIATIAGAVAAGGPAVLLGVGILAYRLLRSSPDEQPEDDGGEAGEAPDMSSEAAAAAQLPLSPKRTSTDVAGAQLPTSPKRTSTDVAGAQLPTSPKHAPNRSVHSFPLHFLFSAQLTPAYATPRV